jgi:hypothetical protein
MTLLLTIIKMFWPTTWLKAIAKEAEAQPVMFGLTAQATRSKHRYNYG